MVDITPHPPLVHGAPHGAALAAALQDEGARPEPHLYTLYCTTLYFNVMYCNVLYLAVNDSRLLVPVVYVEAVLKDPGRFNWDNH